MGRGGIAPFRFDSLIISEKCSSDFDDYFSEMFGTF